jgi:hypothetical protein
MAELYARTFKFPKFNHAKGILAGKLPPTPSTILQGRSVSKLGSGLRRNHTWRKAKNLREEEINQGLYERGPGGETDWSSGRLLSRDGPPRGVHCSDLKCLPLLPEAPAGIALSGSVRKCRLCLLVDKNSQARLAFCFTAPTVDDVARATSSKGLALPLSTSSTLPSELRAKPRRAFRTQEGSSGFKARA